MNVELAHKHSSRHREEILSSANCGCFYCLSIFEPQSIKEWVDHGQTALCPKCGIDSILGSNSGFPINMEFLMEMRKHWFE